MTAMAQDRAVRRRLLKIYIAACGWLERSAVTGRIPRRRRETREQATWDRRPTTAEKETETAADLTVDVLTSPSAATHHRKRPPECQAAVVIPRSRRAGRRDGA
ncbi:hypothetical protein GCM10010112_52340 [Actinoplanes lobatus]|nr:hypothetical protein GCM10010112_52340 [Actinoplanes lobatus]